MTGDRGIRWPLGSFNDIVSTGDVVILRSFMSIIASPGIFSLFLAAQHFFFIQMYPVANL